MLSRWISGLRPRPAALRAPGIAAWADQESLQRFRRAALSELERLERELEKRLTRSWRSNADENRQRAVRRAAEPRLWPPAARAALASVEEAHRNTRSPGAGLPDGGAA